MSIARLLAATLLLLLQLGPAGAQAQAPSQEEIIQELIGAPVFSSDGREVATVLDVSTNDEGQADAVIMKTSSFLGFGERTVRVPEGAFMLLRGAVVLDMPAEAIENLMPSTSGQLSSEEE